MESYRAQQAINSGVVAASNPKLNGRKNAVINGDFFAAFLELITQGNASDMQGQDILAMLGGQTAEQDMMNMPSQDGEENSGENVNAMEMMAGLLNGGAGYNLLFNDSINSAVEALDLSGSLPSELIGSEKALQSNAQFLQEFLMSQAQKGDGSLQAALGGLSTANPTVQSGISPLLQAIQDSLAKNTTGTSLDNAQNQQVNTAQSEEAIKAVTANSSEAKSSSEMLFGGDMSFRNSVAQAQKLLKNQAKGVSGEDDGDNSFQITSSQVKQEAILPDKQMPQVTKGTVDIDDLSSQIKNNLSSGSIFDKKEFSVKLKPEGLGEVTIKLISEQNKMTVSIVTATTEAAKALNDQLPTLREAMRAMQIEVRDVVANSQGNLSDMQQSLQQNGQQNQFTDDRRNHNRHGFVNLHDDIQPEIINPSAAHIDGERMNMYI